MLYWTYFFWVIASAQTTNLIGSSGNRHLQRNRKNSEVWLICFCIDSVVYYSQVTIGNLVYEIGTLQYETSSINFPLPVITGIVVGGGFLLITIIVMLIVWRVKNTSTEKRQERMNAQLDALQEFNVRNERDERESTSTYTNLNERVEQESTTYTNLNAHDERESTATYTSIAD